MSLLKNEPTFQSLLVHLIAVWAISITLISKSAIGSDTVPPPLTLTNAEWAQLVVPGNPSRYVISDLFGPDLSAQNYGTDWIIWTFDSGQQKYVNPGVSGVLLQGQAFWIIQTTGSDITLSLPANLPRAVASAQVACSDSTGCVDLALTTSSNEFTWNMSGIPNRESILEQNISVYSGADASPCFVGCSVTQAFENELVHIPIWHYDAESLTYTDVLGAGELNPWKGFWILTYPDTADSGLILQATGIETQTDPGPLEIEVSPFVEDPILLAIRNTENGASATLVGSRTPEGYPESLDHIRIEGLGSDGEVRLLGSNTFAFTGDDGLELVMEIDDAGDFVGASVKPSPNVEPIHVGQPLGTLSATSLTARSFDSVSQSLLEASAGRPVQVAVTKCGGVPQPDPRNISAEINLSGVVNRREYATGPNWQQSGNVYTYYLPDYDRTWVGLVNEIESKALRALLEFSNPDRSCRIVNGIPRDVGSILVESTSKAICSVLSKAIRDKGGVGAVALAALAKKACDVSTEAFLAVCEQLNGPEAERNVSEAIRKAVSDQSLQVSIEVEVQGETYTPFDSAIETRNSSPLFGLEPINFSLHGGPVDTVTTISSSPNPSKVDEPVAIKIEVTEKDGTGCSPRGDVGLVQNRNVVELFPPKLEAVNLAIFPRTFSESDVGGVFRYTGSFTPFADGETNFNQSTASLHTHEVAGGDVVRIDSSFISFDADIRTRSYDPFFQDLESRRIAVNEHGGYVREYEFVQALQWGKWNGEGSFEMQSDNGECDVTGKLYYRKNKVSFVSTPVSEQQSKMVSDTVSFSSDCNYYTVYGPDAVGGGLPQSWMMRSYSPRWVPVAGSSAEVISVRQDFCVNNAIYFPNDCGAWPDLP